MKMISRLMIAVLLVVGVSTVMAGGDKADGKREKIDKKAGEIVHKILEESESAKSLYDKAVGYAVFDNTKAALGVSGGAGTGVAVDKASSERTYMKMGTAGIGFGIGVKTYQVLILFENPKVFENFINNGWQGGAQASAAAGSADAGAEAAFHDGLAVFVHTKKGLMANADVSGTKYWKSDLNDDVDEE